MCTVFSPFNNGLLLDVVSIRASKYYYSGVPQTNDS
nr:MAG TPA: hypothetical protein [Caudoviricetes sp.]